MALYPIKQLQDKNRAPFFPFNTLESVLVNGTNKNLADVLADIYTKEEINEMFATELSQFDVYESYSDLPATARVGAVAAVAANDEIIMYMYYDDAWCLLTQGATVTVGSTTTGAPGTSASVTNSGTDVNAVLDFVIPKGDKGDTAYPEWGNITGTLADQTDLKTVLDTIPTKVSQLTNDSAFISNNVIGIKNNSQNNPFIITEHEPGVYIFADDSDTTIKMKSTIYVKYKSSNNTMTINCGYGFLILYDTEEKTYVSPVNIGIFVSFTEGSIIYADTQPDPYGISIGVRYNSLARRAGGNETIYNQWSFNDYLPKSSLTPSDNQHLVNKKYVDDNKFSGDYDDLTNKPTIPSKTSDLNNDSGFITGMVELSYGSSTWNDFINAYTAKKIVYCRASSNANPATGSQTRKAFMAYVNNVDNPTSVEFQYVRSISSHSATQQGDQVFVYSLTNANGGTWSVETREMSTKIVPSTGLSGSYSNGVYTLSSTITKVSDLTNDSGFITNSVSNLTNYYDKTSIDTTVNGLYDIIISNIAPAYDDTSTYSVGDYVTYFGYLYVCNTDISVPEDFDITHWTSKSVTDILGNIETLLSGV